MDEDHWEGDHLERWRDARIIELFLRERSRELAERGEGRAYVLNLDADWGAGKTFFLQRLKRQLEEQHLAVYVDSWRDDFADDPLIALMAAIEAEVGRNTTSKAIVRKRARALAQKAGRLFYTGGTAAAAGAAAAGVEGAVSAIAAGAAVQAAKEGTKAVTTAMQAKASRAVADFNKQREAIAAFRADLSKFISEELPKVGKEAPLFILVDELDRCRPPYAIAMLERAKHIFDVPNVVFVFATNSQQLALAISGVYGAGFAGQAYLQRFFDRTYRFRPASTGRIIRNQLTVQPLAVEKLSAPQQMDVPEFIIEYFHRSKMTPRTAIRAYDVVRTLATTWERPFPLELLVLLPLVEWYCQGVSLTDGRSWTFTNSDLMQHWEMTTTVVDEGIRSIDNPLVSDMADEMWECAKASLESLRRPRDGTGYRQWIIDQLLKERAARMLDARPDVGGHNSEIRNYPFLIEQAGQFHDIVQFSGELKAESSMSGTITVRR